MEGSIPGREQQVPRPWGRQRRLGMGRHFRGACEVTLAAMLRGLRGKGRGRGFTRRCGSHHTNVNEARTKAGGRGETGSDPGLVWKVENRSC